MNHYPTAPQSIGSLLDSGFSMYRAILKPMLPLSFGVGLLSQVPQLAPYLVASGGGGAATGISIAIGFLVWMVAYLAIYNGWIVSTDRVARGAEPLGFALAFAAGLPKVLSVLLAFVLYFIAVVIGSILLLIPGIILMFSMFFFWYLILLENQGPVDSLKNSHKLVWGNWWRTLTVVSVGGVVYFVAYFIVGAIAGFIVGVSMFKGPSPEEIAQGPGAGILVFALVQVVLNALLLPMWNSITLVAFRDLQLRKSGVDLAARAAAA